MYQLMSSDGPWLVDNAGAKIGNFHKQNQLDINSLKIMDIIEK